MMRTLAAACAAAIVLAGSVAQAQAVRTIAPDPTAVSTRGKPDSTKGDPDRMICKEITATGSRLGKKKTCRTARDWAAVNAANQAAVKELGRMGGIKASSGEGGPRGGGGPQ
ncbi:MAG: hypothetical protein M3M95_04705 [Pseudomonadota bacterium]|nr:hypothetical protein [Pseudomonadota bacterium]